MRTNFKYVKVKKLDLLLKNLHLVLKLMCYFMSYYHDYFIMVNFNNSNYLFNHELKCFQSYYDHQLQHHFCLSTLT